MSDQRLDDLLKDLDAALSVEPSPRLAARVRTRVAERQPFAMGWHGWTGSVAVGLVAVVVGVALMSPGDDTRSAPPAVAVARSAAPASPASAPAPSANVEIATAPAVTPSASDRVVGSRLAGRRDVSAPPVSAPPALDVQVAPGIAAAFDALREAVATGVVTNESFIPQCAFSLPEMTPPAPLVLPEFVVDTVSLDAEPMGSPNPLPSTRLPESIRSLS